MDAFDFVHLACVCDVSLGGLIVSLFVVVVVVVVDAGGGGVKTADLEDVPWLALCFL